MRLQVAFRADASIRIGTGHVMRCLTLADTLRARGADCMFLCRPHEGHLLDLITARGHQGLALPPASSAAKTDHLYGEWLGADPLEDAWHAREALAARRVQALVVDHYALDQTWEQVLRPVCHRLMVIDDLADRAHDCDLLLDQNLGRTESDYQPWTPASAKRLTGPRYALLRPEFAQWREVSLRRRSVPRLQTLLITLGGVDARNMTVRVLAVLAHAALSPALQIVVVCGSHSPWLAEVRAQAAAMPRPTRVLVGVDDMARWMAESDLAIGAAGSTSWERCCLGLPTWLTVLADNQRGAADALAASGAAQCFEGPEALHGLMAALTPTALAEMSQAAQRLCDGLGAPRVADALLQGLMPVL